MPERLIIIEIQDTMTFDERKEWLQKEHEALITRKNEPIEGNGVYERYKYPILTGEHCNRQ